MPKSRMASFDVFIGTWNTQGDVLETASNPAGTLAATDTYRWLPGRHFIVHDADARFDGKPARSMEVLGFDATKQQYFARSFDDQGATEAFVVALNGRRWRIAGKTTRFNGTFNVQRTCLAGLWERKTSRAGWQPWMKLALARA